MKDHILTANNTNSNFIKVKSNIYSKHLGNYESQEIFPRVLLIGGNLRNEFSNLTCVYMGV